jgi:hypothetical protein
MAMPLSQRAHDLLAGAAGRIEKHRKADATIRLLDSRGRPVRNRRVQVEFVRHAFLFGANIFPLYDFEGAQHETYGRRFRDLLNYATLGFYWGAYEPEQGRTTGRERQMRIAQWCRQYGIATKGHPLVWHEVYPRWAPNDPEAVKPMLKMRVQRIIREFRGLIDRWDVINEATVAQNFDNGVGKWVALDGAATVVLETLQWAKEASPQAFLLYNDYNLSPAFEQLVETLVKRNAPMDAVGIQSHMHQGRVDAGAGVAGVRDLRAIRQAAALHRNHCAVGATRLGVAAPVAVHARGRAAPSRLCGAVLHAAVLAPSGGGDYLVGFVRPFRVAGRACGLAARGSEPQARLRARATADSRAVVDADPDADHQRAGRSAPARLSGNLPPHRRRENARV